MSSSRLSICAWTETSRAETGSSQMMIFGSKTSARATQMRWHCPPENSCERRLPTISGLRPTLRRMSSTRSEERPFWFWCQIERPSRTMSLTLRRGLSEEIGSWKIICMRVRIRRISSPERVVRSVPSKTTLPVVACSSCMTARPVVDLPQPDSPTSPRVSPSRTSKLMPETAWTFCPPAAGNSTTRSSTVRITSSNPPACDCAKCALPVPAISCRLLPVLPCPCLTLLRFCRS